MKMENKSKPLLLGDVQLENEAKLSTHRAVIYFYANWCGPCLAMDEAYDNLSHEYSDQIVFFRCDVDQAPDVVKKFNILAVPTIIFLDKGKAVARSKGISSSDALREKIRILA